MDKENDAGWALNPLNSSSHSASQAGGHCLAVHEIQERNSLIEAMFPEVNEGLSYASHECQFHQNKEPEQGDVILCLNAGEMQNPQINFQTDCYFVGGQEIKLEDNIGGQEFPSVYQTARSGDFSYEIEDLPSGGYFIDLHFAEIFYINGPERMRVFDVYVQGVKILSELDIYAKVGSMKPLIVTNIPVHIIDGESLRIKFEGVIGSPLVNAICIKKVAIIGHHFSSCSTIIDARDLNQVSIDGQQSEERSSGEGIYTESDKVPPNAESCESCCKYARQDGREIEELKRKIELKTAENNDLKSSLQNTTSQLECLRSELMRKSIHVGSLAQAVEGQVSEISNLRQKFVEECKLRKQLYNKLLELKGNIRVFCRSRPLNDDEISRGAISVVDFEASKDCEIVIKLKGGPKKVFKFDAVFTPQHGQGEVFAETAPVVTSVLDGFNACIFAYGQTGSGKTFTMDGSEQNRGVNYRTLEELFRVVDDRKGQFTYDISVNVLEIYNEQIRDLLATASGAASSSQTMKKLEIKQVAQGQQHVHVPGLVEETVHNTREAWEVLQNGSRARAVSATNANEHSSRSHCIICVMVRGHNLITSECTRSKLWLIDLAGSERLAKTDAQGERLKEAQNINKSLAALGDVIHALAIKTCHIPFRNSKLTHLLQDSLGGESKAIMFVQISPSDNDLNETLCSLNFASRVAGVELGHAKKQVEKGKLEVKGKDASMKKMEETIQNLEAKLEGKEQRNKALQEKIKELEGQFENEKKLRSSFENKLKQHNQGADKLEQMQPLLQCRQLAPLKPIDEQDIFSRDLVNLTDVLAENRFAEDDDTARTDCNLKNNVLTDFSRKVQKDPAVVAKVEKENNPEVNDDQDECQVQAKKAMMPKRTSLCVPQTDTKKNALPRRKSMIPLPTPIPSIKAVVLPGRTPMSLKAVRTSNVLNKLRRSINSKVQGIGNSDTAENVDQRPTVDSTNKHKRLGLGTAPAQRAPLPNKAAKERIRWNR